MRLLRLTAPMEFILLCYLLSYLPNLIATKLVTTLPQAGFGRALTGLEILPSTLILNMLMTYAFIWWSGWHRESHAVMLGQTRFPVPTIYTFISGIGTALVLCTVPLSYTLEGVSIPYIQLWMRGDILIIAPLVDLVFGRQVRWWSWVALVMVASSLAFVIQRRGDLGLPPLAIVTIVLYTLGYFIRLWVMTKVSKSGDPAAIKKYFVEEKMLALPMAVVALALLAASGLGTQSAELGSGFLDVWNQPAIFSLAFIALTLTVVSVFAAIILLDARENTFCVPLERSTSLLAGIIASYLLAFGWGLSLPTTAEIIGATILIAAIVLLSVAPRWEARAAARRVSNPQKNKRSNP